MAQLLPVSALTQTTQSTTNVFDLAAPNPILGQTVFIRLPASKEWSYEVDSPNLGVRRNLVLRDQMWVTEGEARFVAVHQGGVSAEVTVVVRPWKPRTARSDSDGKSQGPSAQPSDERLRSGPILSRLHLTRPAERSLRIRCHHTQRQIDLRWTTNQALDLEPLLAGLQCH